MERLGRMLFFLGLAMALAALWRGHLAANHSLYLAVIEDPAALYSLYPWDVLSARQLRAGHFPLWNPYSGTGTPLLANFQSAPFTALKWPFYLWPQLRVLDFMLLARLALAGTFTFMLARALHRSRWSAAFAGAAFALCGYFGKHINMVSVASEMWLPLILYLSVRMKDRRSPGLVMATGLAWWQTLAGGSPEAAFYVSAIGIGFVVWMMDRAKAGPPFIVRAFLVPYALGALLAAAQILPFLEYLGRAWHVHNPQLHLLAPHPPAMIWSLIAPWLAGPMGALPAQKTMLPYLGLLTFLLALTGAFHPQGRSRGAGFFNFVAWFN
jgi:hypothetical protein